MRYNFAGQVMWASGVHMDRVSHLLDHEVCAGTTPILANLLRLGALIAHLDTGVDHGRSINGQLQRAVVLIHAAANQETVVARLEPKRPMCKLVTFFRRQLGASDIALDPTNANGGHWGAPINMQERVVHVVHHEGVARHFVEEEDVANPRGTTLGDDGLDRGAIRPVAATRYNLLHHVDVILVLVELQKAVGRRTSQRWFAVGSGSSDRAWDSRSSVSNSLSPRCIKQKRRAASSGSASASLSPPSALQKNGSAILSCSRACASVSACSGGSQKDMFHATMARKRAFST